MNTPDPNGGDEEVFVKGYTRRVGLQRTFRIFFSPNGQRGWVLRSHCQGRSTLFGHPGEPIYFHHPSVVFAMFNGPGARNLAAYTDLETHWQNFVTLAGIKEGELPDDVGRPNTWEVEHVKSSYRGLPISVDEDGWCYVPGYREIAPGRDEVALRGNINAYLKQQEEQAKTSPNMSPGVQDYFPEPQEPDSDEQRP